MSPRVSLQKPYVLATLSRPIDHSNGRYVIGDVHGGAGSDKRKRAELLVGVDGEGVNLYNISPSRMITSYALPPQSAFTCPPCSLRSRAPKANVQRRTYTSTVGPHPEVTLFYDSTAASGATESASVAKNVDHSQAQIIHMGTVTASRKPESQKGSDLLVVKKDGEIQCYDGEGLQTIWTSPSSALWRDATTPTEGFEVEFAHLTNAYAASQGILKGRQDVFALFPQEIAEHEYNPDILVLVTKSIVQDKPVWNLHIAALPRRSPSHLEGMAHSVDSLLNVRLPQSASSKPEEKALFSIHVSAGILQQLVGCRLVTYDLNDTLPKEQSRLVADGASSFLRLSSTSIMISRQHSVSIHNPKFKSILATVDLRDADSSETLKRKRSTVEDGTDENWTSAHSFRLISYFSKLGVAVAVLDSDLVAIQVDTQGDRENKPRNFGLLLDSLGRSDKHQDDHARAVKGRKNLDLLTMSYYLPGSIGSDEGPWSVQTRVPEKAFAESDMAAFEAFMGARFGEDWQINGEDTTDGTKSKPSKRSNRLADTQPPQNPSEADRRWILYALSKIFSWSKSETGIYSLSIAFFPSKVFAWLMNNGHMSITNIEAALRDDLRASLVDEIPAGGFVNALVETDREMDLLHGVLAKNFLGAPELVHAVRHLMDSLELFGENANTKQRTLTNGDEAAEDIDKEVEALEAEAEQDLQLAEYRLGEGSGVRSSALNLAISKLYTCPTHSIVKALQTTLTSQEIISFIYLLRFELAKGSWTTRYLDVEQSDNADDDDIPDNTILLISSLLNNCIDAIGAGGWLSGDARLVNGDHFESEELIASLKLEVSAALEGIEEATYLKGLISTIVRYGDAVQRAIPIESKKTTEQKKKTKPVVLPPLARDAALLPIGLKVERQISLLRLGAGGEVHNRSMRDVGHRKSKQVGRYTRERIVL